MDLLYKAGLNIDAQTGVNAVHFGQPTEVNMLQLLLTRDYYAWLDAAEEEPASYLDDFGMSVEDGVTPLDRIAPADGSEPHGGELHTYHGSQAWPELGVAVFDCIEASYFNQNIDALRQFYAGKRGEDIDGAHDIHKQYLHGARNRDLHRALLKDFHDRAPAGTFITVHVAFANRTAPWHSLLRLFPRDAWYGLRLTNHPQIGWRVGVVDSDSDELPPYPVRLVTFYDVSAVRRNNLEHVISLDFAPDLPWDPDMGPLFPTPIKVPGDSLAEDKLAPRHARSRGKGKTPSRVGGVQKVRHSKHKPNGAVDKLEYRIVKPRWPQRRSTVVLLARLHGRQRNVQQLILVGGD